METAVVETAVVVTGLSLAKPNSSSQVEYVGGTYYVKGTSIPVTPVTATSSTPKVTTPTTPTYSSSYNATKPTVTIPVATQEAVLAVGTMTQLKVIM